ncbi:MAG: alkaline phosphatase family protein [Leptospirales bacterium]|nr:alkaline phosphatase family protein [Leptospirales bacterium]
MKRSAKNALWASGRKTAGLAVLLSFALLPAARCFSDDLAALPWSRPQRVLLLISIDGFQLRALSQSATPNLAQLRLRGAGGSARGVFPSVTWPAHATISTGVGPALHGVVGNYFLDRDARRLVRAWQLDETELIRTRTFYSRLREEFGLQSAALLWPGSSHSPDLVYNVPEVYGEEGFAATLDDATRRELQSAGQNINDWAERSYGEDVELDALVRDAAVHLIAHDPPDVLMVHFVSYDTRQHRSGPDTAYARSALAFIDDCIGDIFRALDAADLRDRTLTLLVSDHGFLQVNHAVDLNRELQAQRLVRNAGAREQSGEEVWAVTNGHSAYAYALNPARRGQLQRALRRTPGLQRLLLPADYGIVGLPDPLSNPRVGDFVVVLKPDYFFSQLSGRRSSVRLPRSVGMHGYFPDHPAMLSGWILSGAGAPAIAEDLSIGLEDVAPAVLRYFGAQPAPLPEGRLAPLVPTPRP